MRVGKKAELAYQTVLTDAKRLVGRAAGKFVQWLIDHKAEIIALLISVFMKQAKEEAAAKKQ